MQLKTQICRLGNEVTENIVEINITRSSSLAQG